MHTTHPGGWSWKLVTPSVSLWIKQSSTPIRNVPMTQHPQRPPRAVQHLLRCATMALALALLALPPGSAHAQTAFSLFAPNSTPAVPSVTNDSTAVELGVKFKSDVAGDI